MGKKSRKQGGGAQGGGAQGGGGPSKAPLEDQLVQAAKREIAKTGKDVVIRVVYLEGSFKCVSLADSATRIDVALEEAGKLGIQEVHDKLGLEKDALHWHVSAGIAGEGGDLLTIREWAARHFVIVKTKPDSEVHGGLSGMLKNYMNEIASLKAAALEQEEKLKHENKPKQDNKLTQYDTLKDDYVPKQDHEALKQEHEALKQEHEALKQEHEALKQDHEALKQDYETQFEALTESMKGMQTELAEMRSYYSKMQAVIRGVLLTTARVKAMTSLGPQKQKSQTWEAYFNNFTKTDVEAAKIDGFVDLLKIRNRGRNHVAHEATICIWEQAEAVTSVSGRNRDRWLDIFKFVHGLDAEVVLTQDELDLEDDDLSESL